MKTSLFKGLDEDATKEAEVNFNQAYLLRTLITKRLKDKIGNARKKSRNDKGYENPSWAYQQADLIGYERALEEVISILE
jgi:hypothetical protein